MQIILRGKKVRTTVITKSLSHTAVDFYRPSAVSFINLVCVQFLDCVFTDSCNDFVSL